jgi:Zn-dependent M16 (insulinase) family peptidase
MLTHGFEQIKTEQIAELNTEAVIWRHAKTGALLLSMITDDENKAFAISFRTPPSDSTGVAHILEHAVLAGSRKYPLKDPFAELLKGSIKTFLNAFTYSDKTVYPVASTNLKDFYNLVDVYLDTVFHPLLRRQTFEQQGWHYELENAADPLIYKGVVFNEMKGAYSSPDSLLGRFTQQAIFPNTTYGVDSGGDPKAIVDLTYEGLVNFHRRFYHPSNALIFFCGNDDPIERLRILDAYLSTFDAIQPDSEVALQPTFSQPIRAHYTYAATDSQPAKSYVNIAWMLGEPPDTETVFGLDMLEHMLIGTTASPLRKALIDSGLGEKLTGSGLNASIRQMSFWVGLKGVAPENVERVEQLVLGELERLARDGIDEGTKAASINTIEFALRENNTGSFPRGLSLALRALGPWLHGGDPLDGLRFEAPLAAIKARASNGQRYFEQLIETYWLNNQHRALVVLAPDSQQAERETAAELARLEAERAAMDDSQLAAVIDNTLALKRFQETPDAPEVVASIPSLQLSDLDPKISHIPIEIDEYAGSQLLYHDLFTNGIVYLNLGFDLRSVPLDLLPYLGLFSRSLIELGTQSEDFVTLKQRIGRTTGGVGASPWIASVRRSPDSLARLFMRGKATLGNAAEMLKIMRDVLLTAKLDGKERFRQLALESKASLESSIVPGGNGFVSSRLRSRYTEADWIGEQQGGVSYLFFLRKLIDTIENDWSSVQQTLERLRASIVNRSALVANVTLDAASWQQFQPELRAFLDELPSFSATPDSWKPDYPQGNEGLTIPAQVNYVGKGANLFAQGYTLHGSASVISRYLRASYLWEKVRVQGGAYGGGCSFDSRSGVFAFTSYRDPNLLSTLDIYDQTGAWLRQNPLSPSDLTRAIIGTIGDLDSYQLPDAKGWTSMARYLLGESDEERQQYRDEVLSTSNADFQRFADLLDYVRDHGTTVVLGGSQAVEAAAASRADWMEVIKVL